MIPDAGCGLPPAKGRRKRRKRPEFGLLGPSKGGLAVGAGSGRKVALSIEITWAKVAARGAKRSPRS